MIAAGLAKPDRVGDEASPGRAVAQSDVFRDCSRLALIKRYVFPQKTAIKTTPFPVFPVFPVGGGLPMSIPFQAQNIAPLFLSLLDGNNGNTGNKTFKVMK